MYSEERKASDFIQKIKIFFAIINTVLVEFTLFYDEYYELFIHLIALVMVPLTSAMWNERFYYALQSEKPFKMSLYVFERVTLIFPIAMFIATVGITYETIIK